MTDRLRRLDRLFASRVLGWEVGGLNDHTRPLHDPIPNDPDLRQEGGDLCADFDGKGGHRYLFQITPEGYTHCISLCGCEWNRELWRMVDLPHYTLSLDSAWPGVCVICTRTKPVKAFMLETQGAIGSGWMRATFCLPDKSETVWAVGEHPAEALVLACLRAVGVGEEELA